MSTRVLRSRNAPVATPCHLCDRNVLPLAVLSPCKHTLHLGCLVHWQLDHDTRHFICPTCARGVVSMFRVTPYGRVELFLYEDVLTGPITEALELIGRGNHMLTMFRSPITDDDTTSVSSDSSSSSTSDSSLADFITQESCPSSEGTHSDESSITSPSEDEDEEDDLDPSLYTLDNLHIVER